MSILVERASLEDRASFFRKNRSTITRLLGDLAEPAKKPKRKKKAETKAKAKAKPKAKAKEKAKPKAKAKEKAKPKAKAKAKPKAEKPVADNVIEVLVPDTSTTEEACASTNNTPDDLTKISGLGAKMVKNLDAAGITTFEQLANLSKKQITQLGKSIRGFAANYKRKDFKKQAQEFSK